MIVKDDMYGIALIEEVIVVSNYGLEPFAV
jgi:hypothetical protein